MNVYRDFGRKSERLFSPVFSFLFVPLPPLPQLLCPPLLSLQQERATLRHLLLIMEFILKSK